MLIAINLLYLIPGKVGGTETYAMELIPVLAKTNKLVVFCGREAKNIFHGIKNIQVVVLPLNSKNRFLRIIIEQTLLPFMSLKIKADVIFSLGYTAPFIHFSPSIVTIHDLNWYYHPEDFSFISRFIWKLMVVLSALTSNHVITDSKSSALSMRRVLKIDPKKISPILHGVPTTLKTSTRRKMSGRYLLTVVAGYPHKNLSTLLKAFAKVSEKHQNLKLIVCGLNGKSDNENFELMNKLKISNKTKIMGYVPRADLANLYKYAEIFIFPSAYEGFGYPVVEAMSYKTPVISSNAFSLSEVVSTGGILVDPYNIEDYVVAIEGILSSEKVRAGWIAKGSSRILDLNWSNTARQTLKILSKYKKIPR